jgi:hypothetical protein
MRKIGILYNKNMKTEDEAVLSHHNILSEYKLENQNNSFMKQ